MGAGPAADGPPARPAAAYYLPLGRVLALIGGLTLVGAYFMPWFGTQGLILTGHYLDQLLAGTSDLRRFLPGAAGGETEVRLLRALVLLFPSCGALATLLTVAAQLRPAFGRRLGPPLVLVGLVPLVALLGGLTRLPPGATLEIGLWLIGAGGAAVLVGLALDARLARPAAERSGEV